MFSSKKLRASFNGLFLGFGDMDSEADSQAFAEFRLPSVFGLGFLPLAHHALRWRRQPPRRRP